MRGDLDPSWARRVWRVVCCRMPLRARDRRGLIDNTFGETPAMAAVREWSRAYDPLELVLLGDSGVGKTIAAAWWITNSDAGSWRGRAVNGSELCRLDACRRHPEPRAVAEATLAKLTRSSRLVIDNIGAAVTSRHGDPAIILEVILARRALRLPTLLVSVDLDERAMRQRYQGAPQADELMTALDLARRETIRGPSLRPDLGLFPGA